MFEASPRPIGFTLYEETEPEAYCLNCAGQYEDDNNRTISSDGSDGVPIFPGTISRSCDGCGKVIE